MATRAAALFACLGLTYGCSLNADTTVVVFSDTEAGTGAWSAQWEQHFWSWWSSSDAAAPVHQFLDLNGLSACSTSDLLRAGTVVVPGGNAYTYTQHLGAAAKAKLVAFIEGGGLYIGTCAGWYYATRGYYWEYDTQWPDAGLWQYPSLLGVFDTVVEGSITEIADEETAPGVFQGHALATLSTGQHAIYYGGPTLGWHRTSESALPSGTEVISRFSDAQGTPPAIVRHRESPRLLLISAHLEAFEGVGVTELTTAQRQINYAYRRDLIKQAIADGRHALPSSRRPSHAPTLAMLPERLHNSRLAANFAPVTADTSTAHTLSVPLNWSAPTAAANFSIRYFTDDSAFTPSDPTAPIFVSMGGEGTSYGAHCSALAKKHHALCVSVEHRFYGKSLPTDGGASTSNYWRGLSVEANLADTGAVIDTLQAAHAVGTPKATGAPSTARRPVIAFGGSYSGATCAWMRQTYPNKVDACQSSSGVVNAIVTFDEFDEHVSRALGTTCAASLAAAYVAVDAAFDAGHGDELKALFNATSLVGTPLGDDDFMYAIADGPAMMDQYGNKAELCAGLASLPPTPTDEQRIANLAQIVQTHYGDAFAADCFYDSECVKNVTSPSGPSQLGGLNSRSWRFEKCSEMAFLQAAPTTGVALRSKRLTMHALQQQCDHIFGAGTVARMARRNAALNRNLGRETPASGRYGASRIFYLDFSDDPWAEASVKRQTTPELPFCMTTCDGCGHCGAGVPDTERACFDTADAWVDGVLAELQRA